MTRQSKPNAKVEVAAGQAIDQYKAELVDRPYLRHALIAGAWGAAGLDGIEFDPMHSACVLKENADTMIATAGAGSVGMEGPMALLMTQASSLDAIFTELTRRAGLSMGKHPEAFERYMRLALKAQANSRSTLETLARVARGGEQVVRHVHNYIDNRGGQAVVAETVQTGGENGKSLGQSYGPACDAIGPALLGENPAGHALPMPSNARKKTLSHPRRKSRSAQGQ